MTDQDANQDHNIEVPTGSLKLTTYPAQITLTEIVRYIVENPMWGIASATVTALGVIVGVAVAGFLGALLGVLLALVGGYASTRHRVLKEIHRDIHKK